MSTLEEEKETFLLALPVFFVIAWLLGVPLSGGLEEILVKSSSSKFAEGVSSDGKSLAFLENGDIWILPLDGGRPRRWLETRFVEDEPQFSPDGALIAYSAKSRNYAGDASWNPRDWFSVDAGYAKLHANTATGISYFLAAAQVTGQQSIFLSNLHTAHLGVRAGWKERVDFYAGLSISRDALERSGIRYILLAHEVPCVSDYTTFTWYDCNTFM